MIGIESFPSKATEFKPVKLETYLAHLWALFSRYVEQFRGRRWTTTQSETIVHSDWFRYIIPPPISDAIDNIEYFSALYKWFNIDIIEK